MDAEVWQALNNEGEKARQLSVTGFAVIGGRETRPSECLCSAGFCCSGVGSVQDMTAGRNACKASMNKGTAKNIFIQKSRMHLRSIKVIECRVTWPVLENTTHPI